MYAAISVLCLVATAAAAAAGSARRAASCSLVNNVVLGSKSATFSHILVASAADCCAACRATRPCAIFTYEPEGSTCYLKTSDSAYASKKGAVSGYIGASTGCVSVSVATNAVVHTTDPLFKSWNIDASANRQFFDRNLSDPRLQYMARESMPGYLRFGGTGNDELNYAFGNYNCTENCLNATMFHDLTQLANVSGAQLVFALNIKHSRVNVSDEFPEGLWDPQNARDLLLHGLARNYTFYGFELGNEENTRLSPHTAARDFLTLHQLLQELFPADAQPKIIGPDTHGLHVSPPSASILAYLSDFCGNATAYGVPLHALTHHEYIEVNDDTANGTYFSSLDPAVLNVTTSISAAVNASLGARSGVQLWAGEIGPHNGGSPPCDHSSMRWANFADIFWYADALGATARNGYDAFCRQDFVGIDYGMIDCSTYTPLPDYYAGILWSATMGARVLAATTNDTVGQVRVYAHCTATRRSKLMPDLPATLPAGAVTLLVLNLNANMSVAVPVDAPPLGGRRYEYHLSADGGLGAPTVRLNGQPLRMGERFTLPPLPAQMAAAGDPLQLAGATLAFVVFPDATAPACL